MDKGKEKKGDKKSQEMLDEKFNRLANMLPKTYFDQFKGPESNKSKADKKQVVHALRTGKQVDFVKKTTGNKAHVTNVNLNEALDDSKTIQFKLVPKETAIAIQNARNEKKMNQVKLGALVNEKESVIRDIEKGEAVLDHAIIDKIEKALETSLPRPWKKK
jgi:ribosome-binding protein aMBF1 (putative translation factor)